jgi:hypothetical protein
VNDPARLVDVAAPVKVPSGTDARTVLELLT